MDALSRFRSLVLLTATASFLSASLAQADDDEAEHQKLRELRAVAEEAINNNQLELLKPYLADEFSIVTYTDREFSDLDKFKSRWQQTRDELLAGGSYKTELLPELSLILGDVAIARGNSANVLMTGGGKEFRFPSNWTAVLQKVDGQWKIVRAHSSLSPFDNPMVRDGVKSLIIKMGLAALFVGIVVGWAGKSLVSRMRSNSPKNTQDSD